MRRLVLEIWRAGVQRHGRCVIPHRSHVHHEAAGFRAPLSARRGRSHPSKTFLNDANVTAFVWCNGKCTGSRMSFYAVIIPVLYIIFSAWQGKTILQFVHRPHLRKYLLTRMFGMFIMYYRHQQENHCIYHMLCVAFI